jgi:RNA polymerase sigma-54 factor
MNKPLMQGLSLRQQQRQKMAQQIQLGISLLPLNNAQLQRYLALQVQHNPALGWRPGSVPAAASPSADGASAHDIALATHAAKPSLQEHLLQQLYQQPISDEQMLLAEIIVDALDEDGYLSASLRELRATNSQQPDLPSATEQQWQQALALVQSLEPMGVAATDLVDCLRLQLLQEAASPQRELALKLIHEDLKLLAGGASATLAARHNSDTDSVAAALQMIRTLEPKPGRPFAASAAPVQADAEIVQQDEQLDVRLLQPASASIELHNNAEASVAQRQAAQHLLQALQLREQNLYNIISAAASQQAAMLINHDATLTRPLTQTDLATRLGLHPSTISRAVRSRYALWRGKLLPLRKLFSHQLIDQHGKTMAAAAIKATLEQIVATELPDKPYTDAALQQQLAENGFTLARRTVAKYRQQLQIPAAHQRRAS